MNRVERRSAPAPTTGAIRTRRAVFRGCAAVVTVVVAAVVTCIPGLGPQADGSESTGDEEEGAAFWVATVPIMEPRQDFGAALFNGRPYAAGGLSEEGVVLSTVEYRDEDFNLWIRVAPLPRPLHGVALAPVAGRLYALGGFTDLRRTAVDSVYVYDPATDRWQERAPLPLPRGAAAAAVIEGLVYLAGGEREGQAVNDFHVYHPGLDRWEELPALPTARASLSAAAVGQTFYAVGGRAGGSPLAVVEAFDAAIGRWGPPLPPMPTARAEMALAVRQGVLYAIGGTDGTEVLGAAEAYDPDTGAWLIYSPLPVPRRAAGAVALGDRVLIFGGSIDSGFGAVGLSDSLIFARAAFSGCTGDCDYSGRVGEGEIEAAVHRLFSVRAGPACERSVIDTDHDGLVRAADVVAVVRASAGGCESAGRLFVESSAEANLEFRLPRGDPSDFPFGGGVGIGDFDGDGTEDIFVANHAGSNALFLNRGDGRFDEVAAAAGVADADSRSKGVCVADYDNDGDRDIYVAVYGANRLFRNRGGATFEEVAAAAGVDDPTLAGTTCAWGDYDEDGHLDLYTGNFFEMDMTELRSILEGGFDSDPAAYAHARRLDRLYHNRRDGTFEDVSHLLGTAELRSGAALAVTFVDYDGDGDDDIYLGNDFGWVLTPNVLWRNDGPSPQGWRFTDVSASSGAGLGIGSMGIAVGDYDGDLDIDFAITNTGANRLLANRGDGTFTDRTYLDGIDRTFLDGAIAPHAPVPPLSITWGTAFFDYDNDADLDLYIAAGHLDAFANSFPLQPNILFRNQGGGSAELGGWFLDVSFGSGADDSGIGRGVAVADFDADGRLEIVLSNIEQRASLLRYRLPVPGHWLQIQLVGTRSNRDAVGARVLLEAGGQRQMRVLFTGAGGGSQSSLIQHFGLGHRSRVDRIEIRWPSGTTQVLTDVAADQRLRVVEPE